jgi:hypothetical protein
MKVKNTTKEDIEVSDYSFAPGQEIDVDERRAAVVLAVAGLVKVKVAKPKKAKK